MMIPMYNTVNLTDIYSSADVMVSDYKNNGIPTTISEQSVSTLYYLLYAKYGNTPIANLDITQFKYRLFSVIFQYGPTWEKRLDIQEKLRNLSEEEIRVGFKTISNMALNPDSEPTNEELTYINNQNVSKSQKSIVGAYAELWDILKVDVTEDFLCKFKKLFKVVVIPERTYIYKTEEEE